MRKFTVATFSVGLSLVVSLASTAPTHASAAEARSPVSGAVVPAIELLQQLRVEAPSTVSYDRSQFAEGLDLDGDGCRTRQELLEIEGAGAYGYDCVTLGGTWTSWYDGETVVDDHSRLEMDHLVALAEAWRSGAYAWSSDQRALFANDLDIPETLNLVTSSVNQAKSDKDPSRWLPPLPSAHCRYVSEWIVVKHRWNLTVDPNEKAAIENVLGGCGDVTVVVPPAPSGGRPADPPTASVQYFRTSYDGTIWSVTQSAIMPLSFAEWQALGAPSFLEAPTDYVKYPWSATISAVTFFGKPESRWVWKHVSLEEWKRAGTPRPRSAGWIQDSTYYQWAGSSQIFVRDVGGVRHALTYGEWRDSGFRAFESRATEGFVKLSWDKNIAFLTEFASGRGGPIDGARWRDEGYPQPVVASRFPGDQIYQYYGSATIWYAGPTVNRPISFAEWRTMGFPSPQMRGDAPQAPSAPPRPGADKDCDDYGSRAAAQAEFDKYFPHYGDVFRLDGDNDGIACESYFG